MKYTRIGLRLVSLTCAAFVAGCGGGGSSSDSTSGGASVPPLTDGGNIVTQVAAATYAAGSNELAAFQRLNAQRGKCGFGLLAQNAKLDQMANAHRAYLMANAAIGHSETAGLPGFTGDSAANRATAAGYAGGVGEVVVAGGVVPSGADSTEELMEFPYHAIVALSGAREVGISWGSGAMVINTGLPAGTLPQVTSDVLTFPCDGTTDVRYRLSNEVPTPFPAEPAGASWGPTVSIAGSQVMVTKASITGPVGSVAIKAVYTDGGTADPNGYCKSGHACVIPEALSPATKYLVHIEGTQAGARFTKDFGFTTGS